MHYINGKNPKQDNIPRNVGIVLLLILAFMISLTLTTWFINSYMVRSAPNEPGIWRKN